MLVPLPVTYAKYPSLFSSLGPSGPYQPRGVWPPHQASCQRRVTNCPDPGALHGPTLQGLLPACGAARLADMVRQPGFSAISNCVATFAPLDQHRGTLRRWALREHKPGWSVRTRGKESSCGGRS